MPTQIATSYRSDATGNMSGPTIVVAPSDASLNVFYFDPTSSLTSGGPYLATAQSPYTTWSTQVIGATGAHNSQALYPHTADDNFEGIVTAPSGGPFYFTFARSGNAWGYSAVGSAGDPNNATTANIAAPMWVGKDTQGRLWYVGLDNVTSGVYQPASAYRDTGGAWHVNTTLEANTLGEDNPQGVTADIIGNYLTVVYDGGAGGLKYTRIDVSVATLGSWSTPVAITGVSGVSTGSTLSLRAIPGGSTGMLAYTGSGGVRALVYSATTDTWGAVSTLSSNASDRHCTLAAGASGVLYAVWCSFAAANSYGVASKIYSGGAWSASTTTLETSGSNIAWPNATYLSAGAKLALVWTQGTAAPYSVQFDSVAAPTGATASTRTVPASAALFGAMVRQVSASAALFGTQTHQVPASAALAGQPYALSLYGNVSASATLGTANTLYPTTSSSNLGHRNTTLGTATGYGEIYSQGTAATWPALGTLGAPSGHGWLYDSTALEGQEFVPGNWTAHLRLALSATASVTGDFYIRFYKYNAGAYTAIGQVVASGISPTTSFASFFLTTVTLPTVPFAAGDKLYLDVWANVTANTGGGSSVAIEVGDQGLNAGVGGGGNFTLQTPGYAPPATRPVSASAVLQATLARQVTASAAVDFLFVADETLVLLLPGGPNAPLYLTMSQVV